MRRLRNFLFAFATWGCAAFRVDAFALASCPNPPTPSISPMPPDDVCIPKDFPALALPIDFFDDFSWREFIALMWPADTTTRGQPRHDGTVADPSVPRVFESFKAEWELFGEKGATPVAWDTLPDKNPCEASTLTFRDLVLATFSFSKFGNLGEAGLPPTEPLVGTLVSQNGNTSGIRPD